MAYEHTWRWQRVPVSKGLDIGDICLLVLLTIFGGTIASPMFWEFPPANAEVVSVGKDGRISNRSTFLGIPDLPWSDDTVVNLSLASHSGSVTIQPVTANPKVRRLVSIVEARITDPQLYVTTVPESLDSKGWTIPRGGLVIGRYVFVNQIESSLYEFHEKHSAELGKFYNPHDPRQQAEFRDLTISVVGPLVRRKGIEITAARFSM